MSMFTQNDEEAVILRYDKEQLPSANNFIDLNRANRFSGAKMKKHHTMNIADEFKRQTQKRFKGHVTVYVDFYEATMRRDDDNVISGLKFVMDGLVVAGIIKDDSPKYCHVIPERHQSKFKIDGIKKSYIEVKIVESDLEDYT